MVVRSSVKAEFWAMTQGMWIVMAEDYIRRFEDKIGWTYGIILWQ